MEFTLRPWQLARVTQCERLRCSLLRVKPLYSQHHRIFQTVLRTLHARDQPNTWVGTRNLPSRTMYCFGRSCRSANLCAKWITLFRVRWVKLTFISLGLPVAGNAIRACSSTVGKGSAQRISPLAIVEIQANNALSHLFGSVNTQRLQSTAPRNIHV